MEIIRYGHVVFLDDNREGALMQQHVMRAMHECGVITISEDELMSYYLQDIKEPCGTHTYALHGVQQIRAFRKAMRRIKRHNPANQIEWRVDRHRFAPDKWTEEILEKGGEKYAKKEDTEPGTPREMG